MLETSPRNKTLVLPRYRPHSTGEGTAGMARDLPKVPGLERGRGRTRIQSLTFWPPWSAASVLPRSFDFQTKHVLAAQSSRPLFSGGSLVLPTGWACQEKLRPSHLSWPGSLESPWNQPWNRPGIALAKAGGAWHCPSSRASSPGGRRPSSAVGPGPPRPCHRLKDP